MFFYVDLPYKIGKKEYQPCVCYNLDDTNRGAVTTLEKSGKAHFSEKYVFFQSGKPLVAEQVKFEPKAEKREKKARKRLISEEYSTEAPVETPTEVVVENFAESTPTDQCQIKED
jgi:hypothetical protein